MRARRFLNTVIVGAVALGASALATGCDINPAKVFSRNACEVLNCEMLFFVDDLFPLSARPSGDGGGAAPVEAPAEEEDGGHVH